MIVEYVDLVQQAGDCMMLTAKYPAYLLRMTKAELIEQADTWMMPRKILLKWQRAARKHARG